VRTREERASCRAQNGTCKKGGVGCRGINPRALVQFGLSVPLGRRTVWWDLILLIARATRTNIKADTFSLCAPLLEKSLAGCEKGLRVYNRAPSPLGRRQVNGHCLQGEQKTKTSCSNEVFDERQKCHLVAESSSWGRRHMKNVRIPTAQTVG